MKKAIVVEVHLDALLKDMLHSLDGAFFFHTTSYTHASSHTHQQSHLQHPRLQRIKPTIHIHASWLSHTHSSFITTPALPQYSTHDSLAQEKRSEVPQANHIQNR